jgi:hypothetical protein
MRSSSVDFVGKYSNRPADKAEAEPQWRRAFLTEREGSGQTFCLSIRSSDGRVAEGFAMSLYLRHQWRAGGSRIERLALIFSNGAVFIDGQYLQRGLDALEEGKLRRIQAQDANEIAAIRAHNADVRKPEDKEPVVMRALVCPSLDALLEDDETVARIAQAMKEE